VRYDFTLRASFALIALNQAITVCSGVIEPGRLSHSLTARARERECEGREGHRRGAAGAIQLRVGGAGVRPCRRMTSPIA
jgi:hypothetical protein